MKKIMLISLLILLFISVSAVSANDDLNQNITEISDLDDQIEINNEDVLSASSARTFTDLQGQIMRTSAGSTLILEDDYEYTEGTDRTIGIAIYGTTTDIVIDGNGHTLNGKNAARILYVNPGATNIVIKNLNFINGYNTDGAGAIFWKGESGTISNCNFTSDTADKSGGAIIWSAAKGTITDCKFEKCASKSQSGGAIYANDESTQITISNSKFISNSAKTSGAGIGLSGANAIITNTVFTDNSASNSGAAIYVSAANAKIKNSQFIRNKVSDVKGSGGAIFWAGETGTLDNCNFTSNTAQASGGAVLWGTAKGTITNNRFENSISYKQSGGALYCSDATTQTTISNNVFSHNSAQTCGAGIGSAGANSIIANNIFEDNTVSESGAALYTSGANTKINNNQFLRNKAESGGAIYIETNGISMDGCYFEANSITGGGGGAMRWNGNSGTMTNCQFTNNKAATRGGAVYWNGENAKIENNNFTLNTADSAAGGALLYWGNNGQIISNNFEENTATQGYGGALYVDGNSNKVNNNKFNKNTAAKGGGAIYYAGTSGTVASNTITENTAENACGIRWEGDSATITGNTFKGNKNKIAGNIIFGEGAKASITKNTFINSKESDNCIRWNSADATISGNIYKEDTITTLTGSDVTACYGESAKLTFTLTSTTQALSGKTVTVSLNNKNTNLVTDAKGQVSLDISDVDAGTYTAIARFAGDTDYDPSSATANVKINKAPTKTDLTLVKEAYAGDSITLTATVNATEGNVTFYVGTTGESRTGQLVDGTATVIMNGLIAGEYPVTAQYNGGKNYLTSSDSDKFTVLMNPTRISTSDVTIYGGKGEVVFTLVDHNDTPIESADILVSSVFENLTLKTDSNGKVSVEFAKLERGTYQISANYPGYDQLYLESSATATLTATSIEAEDLIADYNNAIFTARFFDEAGRPLRKGNDVTFILENDQYSAMIGDNGAATLTIDKDHGTYTIDSINPITQEIASNKITIKQVKTTTTLTGIKDVIVKDNLTITASVNTSEGIVTFKVNDKTTEVNLTNGKATLDLTELDEGSYKVTATFKDAKGNYLSSEDSKSFKVTKMDNKVTVQTNNITEEEDAVFHVTTTAPNGKVTLTINDESYTENLTEGKATFTVSNLTSGTYPYKVTFEDDTYYASNSTEGILNVKSDSIVISASDLTKYYKGPERFLVTVTDKEGNPLENITVQIAINGVEYNRTTNASGIAGMNIGLDSNNYTAVVIFAGDAEHTATNTTAKITVLPTVFGKDVTKIQRGPEPYYATFLDSSGKVLPDGTGIQFNINGVLYDRVIKDGVGRLNLNLEPGTYIITAMNTKTGENTANTITIKPRIVNNSDVTKFYRNGTQYYVTVLGDNGKPLTGGDITFNINGVFYKRSINENGIARLNLNLQPGKYIITAEYNECRASNNINILPVLTAENITMRYRDGTKFKAYLVDGQGNALPNTAIDFNINGVLYHRNTDENGTAMLNINLMPGKYIITSSYNDANIANTIIIRAR